jgi:hypothetical protein
MMVAHAPPTVAPLQILRPDWETLTQLAFKPSILPDLDACPAPSSLHQFCGATDKLKPAWFWRPNQETVAVILRHKSPNRSYQFWGTNRKTRATDFEAKPEKTVATGFEVKPEKTVWVFRDQTTHKLSTLVLRLNQETCASCLHVRGTDSTWHHPTPDRPAIEYPTCATISDPLHQVSYSCHDPRHCPPCRTCHLHTTRQANTILHMIQR